MVVITNVEMWSRTRSTKPIKEVRQYEKSLSICNDISEMLKGINILQNI